MHIERGRGDYKAIKSEFGWTPNVGGSLTESKDLKLLKFVYCNNMRRNVALPIAASFSLSHLRSLNTARNCSLMLNFFSTLTPGLTMKKLQLIVDARTKPERKQIKICEAGKNSNPSREHRSHSRFKVCAKSSSLVSALRTSKSPENQCKLS